MSDQLKACSDFLSCARRRTREVSPVFQTSKPVRAILLQAAARRNNCSFFQIQAFRNFHMQAFRSLFRDFHWKSAPLCEPQCDRILLA